MLRHSFFKPLLLLGLALFLPLMLSPQADAQSAKKVKNQEEDLRAYMVTISRQLGVTCTTCHNTDNFRSDEKRQFKVGKEHMKLTQLLLDNGMDGKKGPRADCYMCHRGKLMPEYKEPTHPMTNPAGSSH